jgi:hypothetical protein
MARLGDSWDNVVHSCSSISYRAKLYKHDPPGSGWLDDEFCDGFGGEEGCYFTLWTKDHVYFPCCYDGSEWAGSAPRNPCDEAMAHQGGG